MWQKMAGIFTSGGKYQIWYIGVLMYAESKKIGRQGVKSTVVGSSPARGELFSKKKIICFKKTHQQLKVGVFPCLVDISYVHL